MVTQASKPVSIKLDPETKTRLEHLAHDRKRSAHWLMREAIARYLEEEEKRNAFRKAAVQSWEKYQSSGFHATAEEVSLWLSSWGSEVEQEAPLCHE